MRVIVYFRVSTIRQGRSGLGLDAQRQLVESFIAQHGGRIVAEFTEVESGKLDDRPQLAAALAACRRHKARLLVGTLDRVGRDVHLIAGLMKSQVGFVCADRPDSSAFELHVRAAMAEEEGRKISERTKAALAAYKARGGVLGGARPECRNLTAEARQRGRDARTKAADAHAATVSSKIKTDRAAGRSFAGIADTLNSSGSLTSRGLPWTAMAVLRAARR